MSFQKRIKFIIVLNQCPRFFPINNLEYPLKQVNFYLFYILNKEKIGVNNAFACSSTKVVNKNNVSKKLKRGLVGIFKPEKLWGYDIINTTLFK